jgi:hypothetical protein
VTDRLDREAYRCPMSRRPLAVAAALALTVLAAPAAQARNPVVAWVDDGQKLHLYDSQLGRGLPAPALTIPDRTRGFGVSPNGRFVAYRDAAKVVRLYDTRRGTDTPLPGAPGTPRSVSDAGVIASDMADNGPTKLYDGVAGQPVASGLDDANGDNAHRQSRISGNGRFLATTCVTGCLRDTGGDSDVFVQDVAAKADTPFPDDISGQAARDEEHPCISADGGVVGADVPVGNQRDVFLRDRATGRAVTVPGLNRPNASDVYCALDARAQHVAVLDFDTGAARLYTRAGRAIALPAEVVGPVWLVQYPVEPRLIARALAAPRAFHPRGRGGRGTRLSVTLRGGGRLRVSLMRGRRVLRAYSLPSRRGVNRLTVDGRARSRGRLRPLAAGRYVVRIAARSGRARDTRSVAIRVLR